MKMKLLLSYVMIVPFITIGSYSWAQTEEDIGTSDQMITPSNNRTIAPVNDSQITSTIKDKFSNDNTLSNATLNVNTNKGVVNLSGNVDTVDQLSTATQIAQSTPGVVDVESSNVKVNNGSNRPFSDSLITAKIKGLFIQKKLFTDKDIAAMSISVETNNGVVSLSGTASNVEQIDNAIKIARSVKNVKAVKSTVTLKSN